MAVRRPTILVVEDEDEQAAVISAKALHAAPGAKIYRASTLKDAVRQIKLVSFDLILLDLTLPDSLGPETYSTVRESAPMTPIVLVTGSAVDGPTLEAVVSSLNAGVYQKQEAMEGLERPIQAALSGRHNVNSMQVDLRQLKLLGGLLSAIGIVVAAILGGMSQVHVRWSEGQTAALRQMPLEIRSQIKAELGGLVTENRAQLGRIERHLNTVADVQISTRLDITALHNQLKMLGSDFGALDREVMWMQDRWPAKNKPKRRRPMPSRIEPALPSDALRHKLKPERDTEPPKGRVPQVPW